MQVKRTNALLSTISKDRQTTFRRTQTNQKARSFSLTDQSLLGQKKPVENDDFVAR